MKLNHVYGPVPSRRLGRSLGVDPIPLKTCNWNCVYCQLGRTFPFHLERRDYVPADEIVEQVRVALARHPAGSIDAVTFVGSGEPTLHSSLGWMLRQVRAMTDVTLAVITNGSLLHLPEVRKELAVADVVLPTLDAGSDCLYRKLNRAAPELTFASLVEGLEQFRREFRGQFWLEVMLVEGLNDTEEALRDIAAIVKRLDPHEVHLNLPTRPPVEPWVRPPGQESLMRALALLGSHAGVVRAAPGDLDLDHYAGPDEAAADIVTRHPMAHEELIELLGCWHRTQVETALEELEKSGAIRPVARYGRRFWVGGQALFN